MKLIAGYEVLRELSRGGMGEVVLAVRRGPHGFERVVAIKTILGEHAGDEELRSMFADEARLMGKLHHPSIAQVHDLVEEDGALCLIMEYVAGVSFGELIRRKAPALICAQAVAEACRGLHAAHELGDLGVVHRDISPSNLMVTFTGGVKVLDFGIAYMRGRRTRETELGSLKGKPPYMAPEQLSQSRIDRRTDVFGCGVVLWEMLTGQHLYSGSPYEVVKQMMEPVKPPSSIAGELDEGLDEIVLRALEEDPDDRWQTARAMAKALGSVADAQGAETLADWAARELADDADDHRSEMTRHETEVGRATGVSTMVDSAEPEADQPPDSAPNKGDNTLITGPAIEIPRHTRRWPWLAAFAVTAGAAVLWWPAQAEELGAAIVLPEISTPAQTPQEQSAAAVTTSAPRENSSARVAVVPVPGPPTQSTRVAASATAPKPKPPERPEEPKETEEPEARFGWLNFGASPYAIVTLDGATLGPTPFKRRLKVGPHSVVMRSPDSGEVRLRTSVMVVEGKTIDVVAR